MNIPYDMIRVDIMIDGALPSSCVIDNSLPYSPFHITCTTTRSVAGSGRVRLSKVNDPEAYTESVEVFTYHVSGRLKGDPSQ